MCAHFSEPCLTVTICTGYFPSDFNDDPTLSATENGKPVHRNSNWNNDVNLYCNGTILHGTKSER